MQNVVNYLCPFFRNGNPIVNGRVYFVKPDTTAQTFTDIVALEGADFIAIKDKNGTLLENPLSLNSEGRFQIQPFVDDGIDFKMIVCYPTGEPAELHDESMTYDVAYTISSFAQQGEILSIGGVATVDSIAELRQLEPTVESVLVRGFGVAGDFCPPRIFNWIPLVMTDNNGTQIRSSVQDYTNAGTWVCTPSGFVDVRWFGVNPESGEDYTSILLAVAQSFTTMPIYFPAGSYYISSSLSFKSVIMDRLAIVYPTDDTTTDILFAIDENFENRGGRFEKNDTECSVIPKVKGTLRVSWLSSPIETALGPAIIDNVDEIVFDAAKTVSAVTVVENKRILVKKGVTVDQAIAFAPSCSVYYEADGKHDVGAVKISVPADAPDLTEIFKAVKGNQELAKLLPASFILFVKALFSAGIEVNETNFWKVVTDPTHPWYGLVSLFAERCNVNGLVAESAVINSLAVNYRASYTPSCAVSVGINNGSWIMKFLQDSYSPVPIADRTVHARDIFEKYPNANSVAIVLSVRVSDGYTVKLPNVEKPATVIIYNIGTNAVSIGEEDETNTDTSIVQILGVETFNQYGYNDLTRMALGRIVLRAPTSDERQKYGIASDVHWIIDPFAF